jgi:hypothetical protein
MILLKTTNTQVIKRTMLTRMGNLVKRMYPQVPHTNTILTKPVTVIIPQQNMGVIVVHSPELLDDTDESYENNPICTTVEYIPGKGYVKVPVRHPELVMKKCVISNCSECHCTSFCAKPLDENSQSFGHVLKTHSIKAYDANGYSRGTLIQACMSFDNHLTKKITHPKTYDQILDQKKKNENKEQFVKELNKSLYFSSKSKVTTPFNE